MSSFAKIINKTRSALQWRGFALFVALFAAFCQPHANSTSSASSLHLIAEQKYRLTRKLDSLEVYKQQTKRRGESITELEKHSLALKDSIEGVRRRFAVVVESTGTPYRSSSTTLTDFFESIKPSGMFEWVILIISAVAFLCILILVLAITQSVKRKKRKADKNAPVSKTKQNWPQSALPKSALASSVQPAYPFSNASNSFSQAGSTKTGEPGKKPSGEISTPNDAGDFKAYRHKPAFPHESSSDSQGAADIDDRENEESLRRRMAEDLKSIQRFNAPQPPEVILEKEPQTPPQPQEPSSQQQKAQDWDVRSRVLRAARQGVSKHDISRREQISVDQVELILRISSQSSKNRLS